MAAENIMPFGKYKGLTLDDLAARDPQYLDWLQKQADVPDYIRNYDIRGLPDETPAHNALQVRFLESAFRLAVAKAIGLAEVSMNEHHRVYFEAGIDVRFECRHSRVSAAIGVEIKPVMGDDYPAVMRQMGRQRRAAQGVGYFLSHWTLLVDRFAAQSITLEQCKAMFKANEITMILLAEVEAILNEGER